jgi:hypothetical protein
MNERKEDGKTRQSVCGGVHIVSKSKIRFHPAGAKDFETASATMTLVLVCSNGIMSLNDRYHDWKTLGKP